MIAINSATPSATQQIAFPRSPANQNPLAALKHIENGEKKKEQGKNHSKQEQVGSQDQKNGEKRFCPQGTDDDGKEAQAAT